ncbi:MAG: hypothetical protein IPH45_02580 [Bacteroidales bacterium]|nr:hypothetical protein [Bacteroidales bacterium]
MKNQKLSIQWFLLLFLILLGFGIKAQSPTYNCRITNAAQVSCNVWEFDVVLQRTGTTVFKLAQFQMGINMNPAIIPSGGIINITPVPGSSQLNASQQPGPEKFSYDAVKNCIIVTPVAPPGSAGASTISNLPAGTRLTRIRVGCNLAFNTALTPDPTWCWTLAQGYQTKMFAYVGVINTDITVQASHTYVAPSNPTLTGGFPDPIAQTVTSDVTEYCNLPGQGAQISLASTEAGYTYYLFSNGTPVSGAAGVVFGTGSAATFGAVATGAVMSVKSPSCTGMLDMLNTVSLSPANPVVSCVTITASPATAVPPGTSVTFHHSL